MDDVISFLPVMLLRCFPRSWFPRSLEWRAPEIQLKTPAVTLLYNKLLGWLDTKKQPLTNALMKLTHKTLGRDLNGCRRGEALGTRLPARLSHQIYGACASRDTIRHLRVSQLVSLCTAAPSSQNKIGEDTTCLPPKCYRTFAFNFSWV